MRTFFAILGLAAGTHGQANRFVGTLNSCIPKRLLQKACSSELFLPSVSQVDPADPDDPADAGHAGEITLAEFADRVRNKSLGHKMWFDVAGTTAAATFMAAAGIDRTSLSGSISTILTVLSWICVGMLRCGALPSPVLAYN